MDHIAKGTFEVKIIPQPGEENKDAFLARMVIDKQFHGELEGTSYGQMLSAGSPAQGSAGYVALEKVTGSLQGLKGTFVLQHTGTMDKGAATLSVTVVPGSGTDELSGLSGNLEIIRESGKHAYIFSYKIAG